MPAMAGMSRLRWCCLPCNIAPPATRNSSGSAKLKKAAEGLRQNILRSRRYCLQLRAIPSGIGGELQVDVLQRGASHAQLLQPLPPGERLGGELVQRAGGVASLDLHALPACVAVGD